MGIIFCGLVGFCLAFSFFSSFVPWWDPLGALSMNIYAFNHQKKKGGKKNLLIAFFYIALARILWQSLQ